MARCPSCPIAIIRPGAHVYDERVLIDGKREKKGAWMQKKGSQSSHWQSSRVGEASVKTD